MYKGVLHGIADAFTTARSDKSLGIKIAECNKLDKYVWLMMVIGLSGVQFGL